MVYVDEIVEYPGKGSWCHMVADYLDELHSMARRIGLHPALFQNHQRHPHYDLRPGMREKAVNAGAVSITRKELVSMMKRLKS